MTFKTRAEERRYLVKTVELARRCGELNGELLAHIATADTARDLDHLRRLVGDRRLTYFGVCADAPARHSASAWPRVVDRLEAVSRIGGPVVPQTPFRNARRAARRLGNAVLLVHDGYGHLSRRDPSTCVVRATGSYLVDLTTPPSGTVCPSDHLPFDPDFGQPGP
jgi:hypothetical protein